MFILVVRERYWRAVNLLKFPWDEREEMVLIEDDHKEKSQVLGYDLMAHAAGL